MQEIENTGCILKLPEWVRFWEDANDDGDEEFCLYDDDDDKVWDCINERISRLARQETQEAATTTTIFIDELEDR